MHRHHPCQGAARIDVWQNEPTSQHAARRPIGAVGNGCRGQPLPVDEKAMIDRHVRELDRLAKDLDVLDRRWGKAQSAIPRSSD